MAMQLTIARPYARALFSEASDASTFDEWQVALDALALVVACLSAQHLIGNPKISQEQLEAFCFGTLVEVLKPSKDFEGDLQRFIRLLLLEKRLEVVSDIALLYHNLVAQHNRIVDVAVTSATRLTELQRTTLISSLEKRFKRQVTVQYSEDASLIGGLIIKSDDWVFDGSIRTKLTRMAERII